MNKFEKIYSFFSGEMTELEEKLFFEELSKSSELRREFNNYKKINDTIKNNNVSVSSPSSSKENLFLNLGLEMPAASSQIGALVSIKNKWLSGLSYLSVAVLSGVIFYFLINKGYEENYIEFKKEIINLDKKNNKINNKVNNLLTKNNKLEKELIKNKNEYENKLKQNKIKIKYIEKIIYKDNFVESKDKLDNDSFAKNNNNNKIVELNYSTFENNYFSITENSNNKFQNGLLKIKTNEMNQPSILNNFFIELTNNIDFYNVNPRTTPDNFNSFYNNGITIFYNVNNNFNLGLNLIGENYSLKYINTEDDGEYWYYQTPNYLTSSIVGKYNFELSNIVNISPYASGGFNQDGIVVRGGISLDVMLNEFVGILLNSQYSNMIFNNNNVVYNSGKTSIQIGFIWKK